MREQLARLAKGTAIYGIGGVVTRIISFFLLPLFTSYLTPSDYGIISLLGMLSFLLTPVFSLGLGTAIGITYFDKSLSDGKSETIWTSFLLLFVSSSLLTVLGFAFAGEVSSLLFQTVDYGYFVKITTLTTCAGICIVPFTMRLQLEEQAKRFVLLSTASSLASICVTIVMVVPMKMGVRGFIEAGLIGQAITFLAFFLGSVRVKVTMSRTIGMELLRLGGPMVPSFASLFVLQQGNRYVLQYFRGLEEVGLYTVGYNIGLGMNLLVNAFTSAWPPYFLSFVYQQDEARRNFGRVVTYYIIGFGAASLLFYLFARPIVMVLTRSSFHEAFRVVGLSATASFLTGMFALFLPGAYFAREVKYVSAIQAVSAIAAMGVNLLIIPWTGMFGAALSLVIGLLIMVVLTHAWNVLRKESYIRVEYEWNRVASFGAVYLLIIVPTLLHRNLGVRSEIALSFAGVAVLAFAICLILNESEREAVARFLKPLGRKV